MKEKAQELSGIENMQKYFKVYYHTIWVDHANIHRQTVLFLENFYLKRSNINLINGIKFVKKQVNTLQFRAEVFHI